MNSLDYRLLADDAAWARAGEALKQADPTRYLRVLQLVSELVAIHRDPLVKLDGSEAFYMFGSLGRGGES
jgi:hypothetical protein